MKNYRKILPIILVAVMALSWYTLISDAIDQNREYNNYLSEARRYAAMSATKYAIDNYNSAINVKPTVEVYAEVADYYKAQEKNSELLAWCERFLEEHPTKSKSYDYMLEAYLIQKDYSSCFSVIRTADKRNISSEYISSVRNDIAYTYKLDFNSYDDVGIYSNNYSAVKSKDAWGFVDRYGNQRVACRYVDVGAYTQSNLTSVVNSDKEAYFIDKEGSKVLASEDHYVKFGLFVDGVIAAQKESGKYVYVDDSFSVLHGEYDMASTINNGVGAVQIGDSWKIIDANGKELISTSYPDVIMDEKNIVYRNERLFVKSEGGYIMIDSKGKQIGNQVYQDAKVFSDDTYAAVKIDDFWCFIDKDGKLKSDNKYEDARSYMNGMAAVKINGKWGFVDENEELKIPAEFFGAKDFNEKGSCFVMTGDKWQLLKLYRLNVEE